MNAFEYLRKERQLTDETIRTFHLGYCDQGLNIYGDTEFPGKNLELDYKFEGTVLFPIFNLYNDLIGVSARKLNYNSKVDLKYVNTVYPKTEHLYGLNITWPYCLKERKVYVVEGNVDTLMMYQHGIKNVVGMLGSTIRATQLCLLGRFVDEIIFVPDGDTAGEKLIEKLLKKGKGLIDKYYNLEVGFSYVKLPPYFDPDKFLREKGQEQFFKLDVVKLKNSRQPSYR